MEGKIKDGSSESDSPGFTSRAIPVSICDLNSPLRTFAPPYFSWLPPSGPDLFAIGPAHTITAKGKDRFPHAISEAERLSASIDYESRDLSVARPRLFGGASFSANHTGITPWEPFSALQFFLPAIQITRHQDQTYLTVTEPDTASEDDFDSKIQNVKNQLSSGNSTTPTETTGVECLSRSITKSQWDSQIQHVIDQIGRGEVKKVVLAQTLNARFDSGFNGTTILSKLKTNHPDCYQFLYSPTGSHTLFGSSPEQLIKRVGLTILTGALAGSIERGESPIHDEELATELISRPKDQQEHSLVKNEIISDIDPYCAAVFADEQRVKKLDSVQHLYSPITGLLSNPVHVLELVEAIHPSPAVGGIPTKRAKEIIEDSEQFERGWYASPVGWFDLNGNGDFVVSIRSAVRTEQEAVLYAGAGIVEKSQPDLEWDEVQLKYQPVLDVLKS